MSSALTCIHVCVTLWACWLFPDGLKGQVMDGVFQKGWQFLWVLPAHLLMFHNFKVYGDYLISSLTDGVLIAGNTCTSKWISKLLGIYDKVQIAWCNKAVIDSLPDSWPVVLYTFDHNLSDHSSWHTSETFPTLNRTGTLLTEQT